ncbi:hypothetical protein HTT03_01210 [Sulfitobacter sp. S0837]|uniref:hypothetical protein n=1 Tax=Sulfitobacter maritimus TaxID=2741719 RepID=UPI0015823678|nr:hypothetical protein [Sulfitobacter maritimus]NUH63924.1 hypothetical protein [Sulfitobacter maritimus]
MPYFGKYDIPEEIVNDDTLTRDRKIELLKAWRDDKKAYMRASDEGMDGTDRTELLRRIKTALSKLEDPATS